MTIKKICLGSTLFLMTWAMLSQGLAEREIPKALQDWKDWATWEDKAIDCPRSYADKNRSFCLWPTELALNITEKSGSFSFGVKLFHEEWVGLPGDTKKWPQKVRIDGKAVAVVERSGIPSVHLKTGSYRIDGTFQWPEVPQNIRIPNEIGMLRLKVNGEEVKAPKWDNSGVVWLKRTRSEEKDEKFLAAQVYRKLHDGIPMWLQTDVELSVSGKSREEDLGDILPEGWRLSTVRSPIPVAVNEEGRMKAQVRAGKWVIAVEAFRTDPAETLGYTQAMHPVAQEELVAFEADPTLRTIDVQNAPSVDVSLTTFPEKWRHLPVYQWKTATEMLLREKLRGAGIEEHHALHLRRELWLKENGSGYVYRDRIHGTQQKVWRLDTVKEQKLGRVQINGTGQLITKNPETGAEGVEVRTRNLTNMEAVGKLDRDKRVPAVGWNTDVDSLALRLHLPPGWRLFALFGPERVHGDWLTAWSLLDLFLLLIFSLSVFRLLGKTAGIVAFCGFALAYHEPDAPRYAWLLLLAPVALLRVVPQGKVRKLLTIVKYVALVILLSGLIPFTLSHIQSVLYPQLEPRGQQNASFALDEFRAFESDGAADLEGFAKAQEESTPSPLSLYSSRSIMKRDVSKKAKFTYKQEQLQNLAYDPKARIQTGPGVPAWKWRQVSCSWKGPVSSDQWLTPLLIPPLIQRLLTVITLGLLLWLLAILLEVRKWKISHSGKWIRGATPLLILFFLTAGTSLSRAEIPDKEILETLRTRLLEPADCYPHCAEIPLVVLQAKEEKIIFNAEVNAITQTSIPLPGRLPAWSPITVEVDGKRTTALRREDSYLWVFIPEGVHQVRVEGWLPQSKEWEWTFSLKPKRIEVEAPGWSVSGIRSDGTPEDQIFFARKEKAAEKKDAAYDRKDFYPVVMVTRSLEIGLNWQVETTVSRLSASGKAVSLEIPSLQGEQILSSGVIVKEGRVQVRLGAGQKRFSWKSELAKAPEVILKAADTGKWVERWQLVTSPVWNVGFTGISPLYEPGKDSLSPVWRPWPGEEVKLTLDRPTAVNGPTMTVYRVNHNVHLGNRHRTSHLSLGLRCSLGEDFVVKLDEKAQVTSVKRKGQAVPIRREGDKLIIAAQPGEQQIEIEWKESKPLGISTGSGKVILPVESTNLTTTLTLPEDQWVLWACGPLRGPAVRFWGLLITVILIGYALGSLPRSPLSKGAWMLFGVGFTQLILPVAVIPVGCLFALAYRGTVTKEHWNRYGFNSMQIGLGLAAFISVLALIAMVAEGLLGAPEMFILGEGCYRTNLQWFQAESGPTLAEPGVLSVSLWYYRILMLLWALWLAHSLINWMKWGWKQFSTGGIWSNEKPPKKENEEDEKPPKFNR